VPPRPASSGKTLPQACRRAPPAPPTRASNGGERRVTRISVAAKFAQWGVNSPLSSAWHRSCYVFQRGDATTMFDNIFGIHEPALLLQGQRMSILTNNIANADTPGFKARDVDFSAVLANSALQMTLPMSATQAGHIAINDGELPAGALLYRNPYQASLDGNSVEMPVEQAAFSDTNVRYQASLTFINSRISEMQYVLSGQ
jgi:flagellar basal-body rod protein FlgB